MGVVMPRFIYVDTETTGLRWYQGSLPFVVGVQSENDYLMLDLSDEADRVQLKILMCALHDTKGAPIVKVFHNAPFDMHMLREAGCPVVGLVEDTMHLAHLAGYERLKLKWLGKKMFGLDDWDKPIDTWLKAERRRRNKRVKKVYVHPLHGVEPTYEDVPRETLLPYLKVDVETTRRIHERLRNKVLDLHQEQYRMECRLVPLMVEMERVGMRVDEPYLREQERLLQAEIMSQERAILDRHGASFNPGSPKDLGRLIFEEKGLSVLKLTEKGNPALDFITLVRYQDPDLNAILKLRKNEKLLSTYIEGLLERRDSGNIIHPSFRQNGAITGRFSCADPNLQNVPRKVSTVRRAFIPREGRVFLMVDYAQVEMRLFAHYSGDAELLSDIRHGVDTHQETAEAIFGKGCASFCRQIAKTINFQTLYGSGKDKMAETLTKLHLEEGGTFKYYSPDEAGRLLRAFHARRPSIKSMIREVGDDFERDGFVRDIYGKRYYAHDDRYYKGLNYLIQGTAGQVLKRAMLAISDEIGRLGWPCDLVNTVHDEIIFEMDAEYWSQNRSAVVKVIDDTMSDRATFAVDLPVEVSMSARSWADKEKVVV